MPSAGFAIALSLCALEGRGSTLEVEGSALAWLVGSCRVLVREGGCVRGTALGRIRVGVYWTLSLYIIINNQSWRLIK